MGKYREQTRVGPSGPTFCTFQTRQSLYLLNPGNGQVLWQRNDLEPNQGLFLDPNTGFFGDREALVVFTDRKSYSVLNTLNGAEIRRGKLTLDKDFIRMSFGRNLVYVSESPSPSLRIWDPLTDKLLMDVPFTGRPAYYLTVKFRQEFALVLPTGNVRVIDGKTGAEKLDVKLPPEKLINIQTVQVFADEERYYLNIQRAVPGNSSTSYHFNVGDSFLPGVAVQGELYAVERGTNRILWERIVPLQMMIYVPEYRLPFLVSLSRVRHRNPYGGNAQSLQVDVIDCQTGEPLGSRSNILNDRILQLQYDREEGVIELKGPLTRTRLEFGRGRNQSIGDD